MKTQVAIIALFFFAGLAIAQPDRDTAVGHPLDCAFYLLSKDSLEDGDGLSLTYVFFKAGRYDDALRASKFDDDFTSGGGGLLSFALERSNAGDLENARPFAEAGFKELRADPEAYLGSALTNVFKLLLDLSDSNRIAEVFELGGEERRFEMLVALAAAHSRLQKHTMVTQVLDEAMRLPDSSLDLETAPRSLLAASSMYRNAGSRDRSQAALDRLVRIVEKPDSGLDLYDQLFRHHYLVGNKTRAMKYWDRVQDNDDVSKRRFFSSVLIEAKESQKAEAILDGIKQPEFSRYPSGGDVVKQYLLLKRTAKAESVVDRITADPDNYDQQDGYMQIADHYIAGKNSRDARRILDKAFGEARKIEFVHLPQHSVGASPGSRKSIFLRDISERFQKLGDLSKALDALRALDDDHPYAEELLARDLAKFANDNARKLQKKQVFELMNEALAIARKVDADEDEVQIMVHFAEALAKLRDRDGAADKLAELLESPNGMSNSGYALLLAGEVFEKYKLSASDRLRTALTAILDEHDPR